MSLTTIQHRNAQGKLHCEHGPAVIWASGRQEYWINGKLDRDNGPAVIWPEGTRQYYRNGEFVDSYFPDFGCASHTIKTRAQAIERLDRKPRPYSRNLYMADIDRIFPIEAKDETE